MHPNPAYRGAPEAEALAFARARGFGVLTLAGDRPLASHLPYVMEGDRLTAHVVRSNPIWRRLREGPVEALLIVSGPDAYISPDWYGMEDQVPTWNYVAVHLRGQVRLLDDAALRPHLEALSDSFETRLAPKPAWKLDKVAEEPLSRLLRMIAPVEMAVDSVESTFKLGQNKPEAARVAAAAGLDASSIGAEIGALAEMMRSAD